MTGSHKITPLVIGKSKHPRCFKNVRSLPVQYESNKKAWMNSYLFEKWLVGLDKQFITEGRKVVLFLDNCSGHPKDVQMKLLNIRLEFFPPNLTAILQPMDAGVIKCLKSHYRNQIIKNMLDAMEKGEPQPKVNVLKSINILAKMWDTKVTEEVIQHCFKHAGFVSDDFTEEDDNISLALIQSSMQEARRNWEEYCDRVSDVEEDFDDFLNVDDEVVCADVMTDEDIIDSILSSNDVSQDDEQNDMDDDVVIPAVTDAEMGECVKKLYNGFLQKENVPFEFLTALNKMETFLKK